MTHGHDKKPTDKIYLVQYEHDGRSHFVCAFADENDANDHADLSNKRAAQMAADASKRARYTVVPVPYKGTVT